MMGILIGGWSNAKKNVNFKFNVLAEKDEILDEHPDTVIIATGGIPNLELLRQKRFENVFF